MASILLKSITVGGERKDILIAGSRIVKIAPEGSCIDWDLTGDVEVMECSGKWALPGFINMHTHAGMALMRGIGEDMVFQDWIKKIWDIEAGFDYDYVYWSAKVACIEMIRTGTTTFNDQYTATRRKPADRWTSASASTRKSRTYGRRTAPSTNSPSMPYTPSASP